MHRDPDLVEALIAAKIQMGHHRPHPDLPDDASATLYYAATLAVEVFMSCVPWLAV